MKRFTVAVLVLLLLSVTAVIATSPAARSAAKRSSKWVVVATNVYQDTLRRYGVRTDQIGQADADERTAAEVPAALSRINSTFNDYVRQLELAGARIEGARILEVGPGDNLGVALRFLGAGAATVISLDKFVPLGTSAYHQALYTALREDRPIEERTRIDEALDLNGGVRLKPARLNWVYGVGIEESHEELRPESFDLIVSNAVLEEVYAIDEAFAGMDRLLRPGGFQVHKVDLSDYGMFTKHGYHPLEFLTIPDGLYRYMVESTGQPNRRLVDYYRKTADTYGYRYHIYPARVLGATGEFRPPRAELCPCDDMTAAREQIRAIRPRLLDRYRNLPEEDLLIQGLVFEVQKPAANSQKAGTN